MKKLSFLPPTAHLVSHTPGARIETFHHKGEDNNPGSGEALQREPGLSGDLIGRAFIPSWNHQPAKNFTKREKHL